LEVGLFGTVKEMLEIVTLNSGNDTTGSAFYLLEAIRSIFERGEEEALGPRLWEDWRAGLEGDGFEFICIFGSNGFLLFFLLRRDTPTFLFVVDSRVKDKTGIFLIGILL
jgi:hypothetical protein